MKRFVAILSLSLSLLLFVSCVHTQEAGPVTVGIAWRKDQKSSSYQETILTFEKAGATVVVLPEVQSAALTYTANGEVSDDHLYFLFDLAPEAAERVKGTLYDEATLNAMLEGIDLVVFPGGEDISPSLYSIPEEEENGWEYYNATRDVSDYLLMSYALDHDIPVLGICRGMQMLSVVSGATMIQELGEWYEEQGITYNFEHRMEETEHRTHVPHDVTILPDTTLMLLTGNTELEKMPSWHHQAVRSVEGTELRVTAIAETLGKEIIEGVERKDKTFAVGIQYHPEHIVALPEEEQTEGIFGEYDEALGFFQKVLEAVRSL